MVSTDDEVIAEVSKSFGAQVPFMRSQENAGDFARTADVIFEVLIELEKLGIEYENICCLYPTAPFITTKHLVSSLNLLLEKNYDTVFPICKFSFPIQRALKLQEGGKVNMIWPEYLTTRSQDLPQTFHDAGQFYWINKAAFLKNKKLPKVYKFLKNTYALKQKQKESKE